MRFIKRFEIVSTLIQFWLLKAKKAGIQPVVVVFMAGINVHQWTLIKKGSCTCTDPAVTTSLMREFGGWLGEGGTTALAAT